MQQQQPAQTGQWSIPGPPQHEFHPYPPMPHPPPVPSRLAPYPPEVYTYVYQQYMHGVHPFYGASYQAPPYNLGGYPPAVQSMGVPPAAEQPSYPSAPPLAQPSYNQHLEQVPEQRVPEQQAPEKPASVAAAEESVVKRGKRKAVDLDDDDAPPQKKQMVHALLYHPDFELVESNGEARYKCCLPQCENVAAVRQAGIQGHIRSKRHQKAGVRFQSPVCNEAVSRMDPSNISRSCSKNQQEANEVSQRPCEGPTSSQPFEYFSNNFEETTDFTPGEPLQEPVNSLDKTVDSAWDEQVNEFFSIINKAAESTSGEQLEEAVNNFEGTADSASGEQLAFVNSLDKTDDSVPDDLFEYCMNNLDKMYYSAPAPGESLDDLLNRLLSSQAS